ncbi:unnamed protein product, partial [Discosporangium mesarthrocarpum]
MEQLLREAHEQHERDLKEHLLTKAMSSRERLQRRRKLRRSLSTGMPSSLRLTPFGGPRGALGPTREEATTPQGQSPPPPGNPVSSGASTDSNMDKAAAVASVAAAATPGNKEDAREMTADSWSRNADPGTYRLAAAGEGEG